MARKLQVRGDGQVLGRLLRLHRQGVDFTNILLAAFLYERVLRAAPQCLGSIQRCFCFEVNKTISVC